MYKKQFKELYEELYKLTQPLREEIMASKIEGREPNFEVDYTCKKRAMKVENEIINMMADCLREFKITSFKNHGKLMSCPDSSPIPKEDRDPFISLEISISYSHGHGLPMLNLVLKQSMRHTLFTYLMKVGQECSAGTIEKFVNNLYYELHDGDGNVVKNDQNFVLFDDEKNSLINRDDYLEQGKYIEKSIKIPLSELGDGENYSMYFPLCSVGIAGLFTFTL